MLRIDAKGLGKISSQILNHHTKSTTTHLTKFDNLTGQYQNHINGYSKPNTNITATWPDNRSVNTDQFAAQVNQRAARIPLVDRSVCLNEIFVILNSQATAAERADNARSHCLPQTKWIANGNDKIANPKSVRVT